MNNNNVLVWDARAGQHRHVLTGHTGTVHALAFSPDSQILASGSFDMTVRLWPITPSPARTAQAGPSARRRLPFSHR